MSQRRGGFSGGSTFEARSLVACLVLMLAGCGSSKPLPEKTAVPKAQPAKEAAVTTTQVDPSSVSMPENKDQANSAAATTVDEPKPEEKLTPEELEAIEKIEKLGVDLGRDGQSIESFHSPKTDFGDNDMPLLLLFKKLRILHLSNTKVTDEGLKHVKGLTNLERLNLKDSLITDAGLKVLVDLKNLNELNLSKHNGDAGLKEVKTLTKLKTLHVWPADISDEGLRELKDTNSLEFLFLGKTKTTSITDAGLKELKGLTNLQILMLGHTTITDAGLKELKGLTNLQILVLGDTTITDAGLKELKDLNSLEHLSLYRTPITDAGLKELNGLPKLESLDMTGTKITDAGLKELKDFKALRTVNIRDTPVTATGVAELKEYLPELSVSANPRPTDPIPEKPIDLTWEDMREIGDKSFNAKQFSSKFNGKTVQFTGEVTKVQKYDDSKEVIIRMEAKDKKKQMAIVIKDSTGVEIPEVGKEAAAVGKFYCDDNADTDGTLAEMIRLTKWIPMVENK